MNKNTVFLFSILPILVIPVVRAKQTVRRQSARVPAKAFQVKAQPSHQRKPTQVAKKRIVIFSSRGGGGHTAVSNGLRTYLGKDYDIQIVNVFDEILSSLDTFGTLSLGKVAGEDVYNFCLRCRWTNLAGGCATMGATYFRWRQSTVEKLLIDYFKFAKPDLIISVIPFLNAPFLAVAEKLQIPLLVLTNDLDTTNYINALVRPTYAKFRYTLPFDDPTLRDKIKSALIPDDKIVITGFPLRPAFFRKKDIKALKKKFKVPLDKPVVMVCMGAVGSLTIYRYVRTLARMKMPLHMIIVLGRNEQLKRNINKILLPPGVTITLLGFTDRMPDLMVISDVLITKPGPGTVCEAIESNLPMILDQTHGTLWWEELNVAFVLNQGFGATLTQFDDLPAILKGYLNGHAASIKQKMKNFKRECFELKIEPLIQELIAP